MGHSSAEQGDLRSTSIGTEVSAGGNQDDPVVKDAMAVAGGIGALPLRDRKIFARYVRDMEAVITEISRVLVPRGRCVLVIGDCMIRGAFVRNSEVLKRLGERSGLFAKSRLSRELPPNRRYPPPPPPMQPVT